MAARRRPPNRQARSVRSQRHSPSSQPDHWALRSSHAPSLWGAGRGGISTSSRFRLPSAFAPPPSSSIASGVYQRSAPSPTVWRSLYSRTPRRCQMRWLIWCQHSSIRFFSPFMLVWRCSATAFLPSPSRQVLPTYSKATPIDTVGCHRQSASTWLHSAPSPSPSPSLPECSSSGRSGPPSPGVASGGGIQRRRRPSPPG